jgi:hypothetical protein
VGTIDAYGHNACAKQSFLNGNVSSDTDRRLVRTARVFGQNTAARRPVQVVEPP